MDILVQLKAVRAALKKVEGNILKRHMGECVVQAMGGNREEAEQKVAELLEKGLLLVENEDAEAREIVEAVERMGFGAQGPQE